MSGIVQREQLEAVLVRSAQPRGRASQLRRVNGIEDYLFIGGDRIPVRMAAERLGVTDRTVRRWRAALRNLGALR